MLYEDPLKVDVMSSSPFWLKDPLIYLKHPLMKPLPHDTGNLRQADEELLPLVARSDLFWSVKLVTVGNTHFAFFFIYFDNWGLKWHQTFWEIALGVHSWLISSSHTTITGCHTWNCANPVADWVSFCASRAGSLEYRVCLYCKGKLDSKSAWKYTVGCPSAVSF